MANDGPIQLKRPVEAIEIPYGTRVMLPAGAEVRITQSLGGSYTVLTEDGYLVRIADKDADALGIAATSAGAAAAPAAEVNSADDLEKLVWQQLETLYDPEIPVNVVELGLVYGCKAIESGDGYRVEVQMTLTAPGCGMGDVLRAEAESKIQALPKVKEVSVEMVVDPPWDPSRMSDAARLQLNMM
jgi:probable FeS assembly SUF system protein SufT